MIQGFFFSGKYANESEKNKEAEQSVLLQNSNYFFRKELQEQKQSVLPNGQTLFSSYTNKRKKENAANVQRTWLVFHSSIRQDWIAEKELQSTKTNLEISDQTWKYCLMALKGQHGFFHLTTIQLAMGFVGGKHFKSANTSPIFPSVDYFSKGKTWPLLE